MTNQQRADWFNGKWIAIRPNLCTAWYVRRCNGARVVESDKTFPSEAKAQRWADKLNAKEVGDDPSILR